MNSAINDKLDNLDKDKREKIIQALLDEFSANGYRFGSTNTICKEAGISKGSLFNYLGNKKEQYIYIVKHVMGVLFEKMISYSSEVEMPSDYFDQLKVRSALKIRLGLEYPKEYRLMLESYLNPHPDVEPMLEGMFAAFTDDVMEGEKDKLDPDLLKDPGKRDLILKLIYNFISGYTETYFRKNREISPEEAFEAIQKIMDELEEYFQLIRDGYFK